MTTVSATKLNLIGLSKADYKGNPTTLCAGCGHNSISNQIIAAAYELGLKPEQVVKFSGIGCSSKSPAYFLNRSHGFNAVHGRMPSAATGALMANRDLLAVAVSGDGDTASIGLGQFKHLVRRNVPMVYIVENNGVYGLTKGQFSATADMGQELKYQGRNELPPIDICLEAVVAGAGFVARSFAGDSRQVTELLKAAVHFRGTAVLDIISPCVTFNDHENSTKSYVWGKTHNDPLQDITYIPTQEEIMVDYEEGTSQVVAMHDGSQIVLKKLGHDYDPTDRQAAFSLLEKALDEQQFITGLIYYNPGRPTLQDVNHMMKTPLVHLTEADLRPSRESLERMMAEWSLA